MLWSGFELSIFRMRIKSVTTVQIRFLNRCIYNQLLKCLNFPKYEGCYTLNKLIDLGTFGFYIKVRLPLCLTN
jgi:hypothetical protein